MDENDTPKEPGQVPPPPPEQPPAAPFGDPPAPEQPVEPPVTPTEPPGTPPPPPPPSPGEPPATEPTPPPVQPPSAAQYQQPPVQPAAGQPMPTQPVTPPAKKSSTAVILIVVAIVALLCALTACGIGAYMALTSASDVEQTIEDSDVYYDSATTTVEEVDLYYDQILAAVDNGDPEGGTALADEAFVLIEDARSDLDECQALNESLDESTYRTEYLDAIAQLDLSLDSYEELYTLTPQAGEIYDALDVIFTDLEAADEQLDISVDLTNSEEYESAKKAAESALATYSTAETFFNDLHVRFPDREFDVMANIESIYVDAAQASLDAANAGIAQDTDAFNDAVDAYDDADDRLGDAPWPYWADDWSLLWESTDLLYEEAWNYYLASLDAWNRATDAYNAGDY